jgi:tRNA-2-methylthio-N6-dimethylallyladenosine synthase
VAEDEKTRRIVALQSLQREIQIELHEAMVGTSHDVLVDAASRRRSWEISGRTSGNTVVNLPGDRSWIGRIVPVAIKRAGPNSVWGEAIAHPA